MYNIEDFNCQILNPYGSHIFLFFQKSTYGEISSYSKLYIELHLITNVTDYWDTFNHQCVTEHAEYKNHTIDFWLPNT